MSSDPITDEIRAIRHKLAAECDNDVSKILAKVREGQASDGRIYLTLPKREPRQAAPKTIAQTVSSQD